jgi:integrase
MAIHKNARGRYIVQLYDPQTSRMRHVGSYKTRREAVAAEADQIRKPFDSTVTVAEFAARWPLPDYPRPKDSTNYHNRERIKNFAAAYGSRPLAKITRSQARAWVMEHPGELSALRAMYSDALGDDLVTANPFHKLGLKQKRSKRDLRPDWLTEQDVRQLAETPFQVLQPVTAQLVSCAITFSAFTGLRPGELFALEEGDVLDNEVIVSKAVTRGIVRDDKGNPVLDEKTKKERWEWQVGPPKNGKARVVALPEIARKAFDSRPRLHDSLAFTSVNGRRLYQSAWYNMWNPVRVAFGRPNMHYYELRHFTATRLLELGLTASEVAVQLGHTDGGQLILEVYGHPSETQARDRVRQAFNDRDVA